MELNRVLISIVFLIFCGSVVIFFAKDIAKIMRKIFFLPGSRLLAVLALTSWVILVYESWEHWLLLWIQDKLHYILNEIAHFLPFKTWAVSIIHILFLFCLACSPLWVYKLKAKRKKHRIPPTPFIYYLSLILWTIGVFLISVS